MKCVTAADCPLCSKICNVSEICEAADLNFYFAIRSFDILLPTFECYNVENKECVLKGCKSKWRLPNKSILEILFLFKNLLCVKHGHVSVVFHVFLPACAPDHDFHEQLKRHFYFGFRSGTFWSCFALRQCTA